MQLIMRLENLRELRSSQLANSAENLNGDLRAKYNLIDETLVTGNRDLQVDGQLHDKATASDGM